MSTALRSTLVRRGPSAAVRTSALSLFAILLLLALPAAAQFGLGVKRPNITNIFRPVVGNGAVYEETDSEGKKTALEMSIVDSEMVGTQRAYWMEVGHTDRRTNQLTYGKSLITPEDFKIHKSVFVMPGSSQPVLMDMDESRAHRDDLEKSLEKWRSAGTESITVPAGTFQCEHWSREDGKGDVWASSQISPFGMVKSVENGRTLLLARLITGAKTHIIGTPVKFDPQMTRQQLQQRHGKNP
jgi:hypothetical protein